jgi:hypothetical protein
MTDDILTGRAAEEHKHGFREMPAAPTQRSQPDFDSARDAGKQLSFERKVSNRPSSNDVDEVRYQMPNGKKIHKNQTVTPGRAADDLKQKRINDSIVKEWTDRDDIARRIDRFRADNGQPTDPTAPVDPMQMDPHLFGDLPIQAPQIDPQHLPQDLRQPGVDEVQRFMQNPQVREHFEQEHGKVAQQVELANDFARGAFYSVFPQTKNFSAAEMTQYLTGLAKINPQKFKQAQSLLDNVAKAGNARQIVQQQRAHVERQQFQSYAQEQDAAFDRMVGKRTPQQRQEIATEMVNYAAEMGVDRKTLTHILATNPIARHSAFQKMIHDAVAGRLARKQLAEHQRQQRAANLPPVQRPGTATNNSAAQRTRGNDVQRLAEKFSRTLDPRDAAALISAQRRG